MVVSPLAGCLTSPMEIECRINLLKLSISGIKKIILKCIDWWLKHAFVYELEFSQGYPKLSTLKKVYRLGYRKSI